MYTRGWKHEEAEKLVAWIEQNEPVTRNPVSTWSKRVKEEAFPDNDNIDLKKIKSKYHNMRSSYKTAKAILERSGYGRMGVMPGDPLRRAIEKKCVFFWRLERYWAFRDDIWVSRPSITPTAPVEVIPDRTGFETTPQPQADVRDPRNPRASGIEYRHDNGTEPAQPGPEGTARENDHAEEAVEDGDGNNNEALPSQSVAEARRSRSQTPRSASREQNGEQGQEDHLNPEPYQDQISRTERSQNWHEIDTDTCVRIARIQADSVRQINESSQNLILQLMQRDREREERQMERDRENGERQMAMLRMILESFNNNRSGAPNS